MTKPTGRGRGWGKELRDLKLRRRLGLKPADSLNRARVYRIWKSMHERCRHGGGRYYVTDGIEVCARWNEFKQFLDDMGEPPTPKHSLDRRDNNGPYNKRNCRWATYRQQARNSRKNIRVPYRGKLVCLSEACERVGLKYATVYHRLIRGWPVSKILQLTNPQTGEFL